MEEYFALLSWIDSYPAEGVRCLQKLLREHAPGALLPFMFRHGRAAAACELAFPPANGSAGDSSRCRHDARWVSAVQYPFQRS